MTAEPTNKQFRNCGNVSDRWKHAWLIAMLDVIVSYLDDDEPLTYAETNTFLLGAPTRYVDDWLAWAKRAPRSSAMVTSSSKCRRFARIGPAVRTTSGSSLLRGSRTGQARAILVSCT